MQVAGIVHLLVQLHLEGDLPELLVAPARFVKIVHDRPLNLPKKKDYDLYNDYLLILFLTSECPKRKAAAPKALATVGFTESLYPR